MGEHMLTIPATVAFIFRNIIFIIAILTMIVIFTSLKPVIENESLIRVNSEIADNILASNLMLSKGVFDPAKLEDLRDSDAEKPVRHCNIGYTATVATSPTLVFGTSWFFGYMPGSIKTESVSLSYPAGIWRDGNVAPAIFTVTVYRNVLTDISCTIERAYKLGEKQSIDIPCMFEGEARQKCSLAVVSSVKKGNNYICISAAGLENDMKAGNVAGSVKGGGCRFVPGTVFKDATFIYEGRNVLTVYPVAGNGDCSALKKGQGIAAKEQVSSVVLCAEK
jgi:hypothetical protein